MNLTSRYLIFKFLSCQHAANGEAACHTRLDGLEKPLWVLLKMSRLKRKLRGLVAYVQGIKPATPDLPARAPGIEPSRALSQALDTQKFVFVCGLHRSGTSLLAEALASHPLISGFHNTAAPKDEGQHLQSVFLPARVYGGPGKFGFARKAHLTETSDLITADNAKKLFAEWSRYWDLSKSFLLEKSPPNLIRTRFLQAIFPPSYFIVLVRHPVAVAFATQKWSKSSLESLIRHWAICHQIFAADRVHLKNACVVRYEDLVSRPQLALTRICDFLSLGCDLQLPELNPEVNRRYMAMWSDFRRTPGATKLVNRLERRYGETIAAHGYRLDVAE